jgi:hypothetical protein
MPNSNPLLQIQIKLTAKQAASAVWLIHILKKAHVFEGTDQAYTLLLNPPKGTVSNQLWAEQVYKHCLAFNIPALIVRPTRGAQEVASD